MPRERSRARGTSRRRRAPGRRRRRARVAHGSCEPRVRARVRLVRTAVQQIAQREADPPPRQLDAVEPVRLHAATAAARVHAVQARRRGDRCAPRRRAAAERRRARCRRRRPTASARRSRSSSRRTCRACAGGRSRGARARAARRRPRSGTGSCARSPTWKFTVGLIAPSSACAVERVEHAEDRQRVVGEQRAAGHVEDRACVQPPRAEAAAGQVRVGDARAAVVRRVLRDPRPLAAQVRVALDDAPLDGRAVVGPVDAVARRLVPAPEAAALGVGLPLVARSRRRTSTSHQ